MPKRPFRPTALTCCAATLLMAPAIATPPAPGANVAAAVVPDQGLRYQVSVPDGWQVAVVAQDPAAVPVAGAGGPQSYALLFPQGQKDGPVSIRICVVAGSRRLPSGRPWPYKPIRTAGGQAASVEYYMVSSTSAMALSPAHFTPASWDGSAEVIVGRRLVEISYCCRDGGQEAMALGAFRQVVASYRQAR